VLPETGEVPVAPAPAPSPSRDPLRA
jgi:hypothetical protein